MKCNQKIKLFHHYQQENYTVISVESEKKVIRAIFLSNKLSANKEKDISSTCWRVSNKKNPKLTCLMVKECFPLKWGTKQECLISLLLQHWISGDSASLASAVRKEIKRIQFRKKKRGKKEKKFILCVHNIIIYVEKLKTSTKKKITRTNQWI